MRLPPPPAVKTDEVPGQSDAPEKATRSGLDKRETPDNNPQFHTVEHGDTLEAIANKYRMSLNHLLRLNGLAANSRIYPGQTIVILKRGERKDR